MSRHFGGPGNYERRFRQAETEQDLDLQAEIQRGWNQAGLWCFFLCAAGALCFGWRMGWVVW